MIKVLIENEALMFVFSWIGILIVAGFVVAMLYCAFDALRDVVHGWRWHYKYKHRFDKPPTAACYCKDCVHHGTRIPNSGVTNACCLPGVGRYTPDNGFCYEAEPRKKDNDAET